MSQLKKYIRFLLLLIPLVFLFTILLFNILAPILEYQRLEISSKFYEILHNICHQVPTRCLWIKTSNMALCARCFFIYMALFITGLTLIKYKTKHVCWKIGFVLMIPCIIDGSLQYMGFRVSNNILRSITGGFAGIGIGMIFFPLYFRLVDSITRKRGGNVNYESS